jgi:hypothetical protein
VAWNLGRVNTSIVEKLRVRLGADDLVLSDFMTTATIGGKLHTLLQFRRAREYALWLGDQP